MSFQERILTILSVILLSACGGDSDSTASGDNPTDDKASVVEPPEDDGDDVPEQPVAEYEVTTSVTGEGKISPTSQIVVDGGTVSFNLSPESYQRIASVSGCNGLLQRTTYTIENTSESCEIVVAFEHEAIKETWTIEDPVSAYNSQCEAPTFFFAIPVDVNQDGNEDLITHYWCGSENFGSVSKDPTGDALAALVSDGAGNFALENTSVFGSPFAQLGGAARKYARGDLNADGMEDFVFAMNWEDGRASADVTDITTQQSVLLSNSAGRYSIERLGSPDWGHATSIVKNPDGSKDALFAGFLNGVGLQVFTRENDNWINSAASYPAVNWAVTIGTSEDLSGFTDHIFGSGGGGNPSLDMFSRVNGSWAQTSTYEINKVFQVDWVAWNDNLEPVDVVSVNGDKYFMGSYFATCTMPNLFGDDERYLIGKVSGAAIEGEIVEGEVYDQDDTRNVGILQFFKIENDSLVLIDSPIVDEEIDINANFFDCNDVNGDGLSDVVVYAYTQPWANSRESAGGKPIVYINDGQGRLHKKSLAAIPGHSAAGSDGAGPSLQSLVHDMNDDGVKDILLFGSSTGGVASNEGNVEIHILREEFWSTESL